MSEPRLRWRARIAAGRCHVFAYLPSAAFVSDPAAAGAVRVRFTLADGREVQRPFRPDFADWFSVPWPDGTGPGP